MSTIMSGIEKIDTITGGFHPGELIFIAGRPEMGKTTLLSRIVLNMAQKAVRDKNPEFVLYFNLDKTVLRRIPRFRGIKNLQAEAVITYNRPAVSTENIAEKLTSLKKTHRISVVAIDYLQLIGREADGSRKEEAIAIVSALKQMAVEENICILLTSYLRQNVDKRRDHIPQLSDLEILGDIEQLIDMVIFLHLPYQVVGMPTVPLEIFPGPTTVTIAKNLHGGIGSCELRIKEFGESEMDSWTWESNMPLIIPARKNWMQRDRRMDLLFIPSYQPKYYNTRRHLRWLFFGSLEEGKPDEIERQTNGYVVNGLRMNEEGFFKLNADLRWQIAEDDPIMDHDVSESFLEVDQFIIPEQYNAICPLDGYVLAINAESYWRLPLGEHISNDGPDSVYRLCPHCLMNLASRNIIRRCIRGVE